MLQFPENPNQKFSKTSLSVPFSLFLAPHKLGINCYFREVKQTFLLAIDPITQAHRWCRMHSDRFFSPPLSDLSDLSDPDPDLSHLSHLSQTPDLTCQI